MAKNVSPLVFLEIAHGPRGTPVLLVSHLQILIYYTIVDIDVFIFMLTGRILLGTYLISTMVLSISLWSVVR